MTWKLALSALLIGIVGCLLALGGWHLYIDHQHIDAVWQVELQRSAIMQQQQQQAAPQPQVPK